MAAQPDYAALFQDDDLVGMPDRPHPLGHNKDGCIFCCLLQGLAQGGIGAVVKCGKRIIKNINLRLPDQATGDCQPLFLAAGYIGAALG